MQAKRFVRAGIVYGVFTLIVAGWLGADVASLHDGRVRETVLQEAPAPVCEYDATKDPIDDYNALVAADDPIAGNPDAPVTIIEFFDPNCPHCRNLHPVMKEVGKAYGNDLRIVYKPIALSQFPRSPMQNAALFAAAAQGKFLEMLDLQFARHRPGGLPLSALKQIAREIGMDDEAMEQQINAGIYEEALAKRYEQARAAGLTGVPAVILNGRFVSSSSRTVECLGQLIEAAVDGQ